MNAAVFSLSAAILAYEVVLMRMFSIAQWHHFAAMIISIAFLGFGLSGTLLSLWGGRPRRSFGLCALGFALSVPLCTWLAQQIPFTPFLIVWQARQLAYLLAIYLLLVVPFTAGALAIGLALTQARERGTVGSTYAANLVGSGLGAVAGLALCFLPLPVRISEYKGLQKALVMADARLVRTEHHPLGRVDVVECPALRVAPGLSIAYSGTIPTQQVVFVDADGGSAANQALSGDPAMAYLEWLPSAAPYQLGNVRKVLIIGVGAGAEAQQAVRFGATKITGVELNPGVRRLAVQTWRREWRQMNLTLHVAEGRSVIQRSRERYDLIQISLLDSLAATAGGVGAANETYLYTVEALDDFLAHLTDSGVLCITRWLKSPPRDNVKLFATAVEALERAGVREPAGQLMFVRGWATGTLLVKRTPFAADEIAHVRRWADERVFDADYFPGVTEDVVNQRNIMTEPLYFRAAMAILFGDREQFYRNYVFNVRPATDDRPYFFHFFRWRLAPRLLRVMGREWVPFVEWGYIVSVATLAQAVVASVVLIGLPLRFSVLGSRFSVLVYFGSLGLAFMFLEIALLAKFTLFLGNPLYSAAVVIATFLVFAGFGAAQVGRRVLDVKVPAIAIVAMTLAHLLALPLVFDTCLATGGLARVGLTVTLLAPLAFFMGMMFPLGLGRIPTPLVPWAWGVNGCCSVIGAALASVLAMDFGFSMVLVAGGALYGCAAAVFGRLR